MSKPAAVIDKSLLQAICEQDSRTQAFYFKEMADRYQVVVASVLIEEIWINLAKPQGNTPPLVLDSLVHFVGQFQNRCIAEPLEIAFLEMVKAMSIRPLPRPANNLALSFSVLSPDDPALVKWVIEKSDQTRTSTRERVKIYGEILPPDKCAVVKDGKEFFERFIRKKFVEILADPVQKKALLENELGLAFRAYHPESSDEIDKTFDSYTPDTFDKYQAALVCIIAAMVYFYAPLCKLAPCANGRGEPLKILGRKRRDQSNNSADLRYVQSALLCDRLLTRDRGMHNVMELFKNCGFWDGISILIDPKLSLENQIPNAFV